MVQSPPEDYKCWPEVVDAARPGCIVRVCSRITIAKDVLAWSEEKRHTIPNGTLAILKGKLGQSAIDTYDEHCSSPGIGVYIGRRIILKDTIVMAAEDRLATPPTDEFLWTLVLLTTIFGSHIHIT